MDICENLQKIYDMLNNKNNPIFVDMPVLIDAKKEIQRLTQENENLKAIHMSNLKNLKLMLQFIPDAQQARELIKDFIIELEQSHENNGD